MYGRENINIALKNWNREGSRCTGGNKIKGREQAHFTYTGREGGREVGREGRKWGRDIYFHLFVLFKKVVSTAKIIHHYSQHSPYCASSLSLNSWLAQGRIIPFYVIGCNGRLCLRWWFARPPVLREGWIDQLDVIFLVYVENNLKEHKIVAARILMSLIPHP